MALVLVVTGVLVGRRIWPASPTPAALAPPPPQNRYGAPIPTAPRDVPPLEENVCGALDPSQWKALNIEPAGRPGTAITDWPTCEWQGVSDPRWVRILGAAEAETSEHVSISATTSNDNLVGIYYSHMFDITEATTNGGLPTLAGQNSVTGPRATSPSAPRLTPEWTTTTTSPPTRTPPPGPSRQAGRRA